MANQNMSLQLAGINSDRITALETRTGKVVGSRITFGGKLSAADIKASLKQQDPTLKGAALTRKVNDVLTGREPMAWAEHDVLVSAMRSAGYIPNTGDVRGKSGLVRYVKPSEPAASKLEAANKELAEMKAKFEEQQKQIEALQLALTKKS